MPPRMCIFEWHVSILFAKNDVSTSDQISVSITLTCTEAEEDDAAAEQREQAAGREGYV